MEHNHTARGFSSVARARRHGARLGLNRYARASISLMRVAEAWINATTPCPLSLSLYSAACRIATEIRACARAQSSTATQTYKRRSTNLGGEYTSTRAGDISSTEGSGFGVASTKSGHLSRAPIRRRGAFATSQMGGPVARSINR